MPEFYNRYPNLKPQFFEDEYLVYQAVSADDYRILATFGPHEYTQDHIYLLWGLTDLKPLNEILEAIYMYTGVWNFDIFEEILGKIFGAGFITKLQSAVRYVLNFHKFSKTKMLTIVQGFKK